MARRLLVALVLAALGGLAWWMMRAPGTLPEGLVLELRVVDAEGQPVPGAQVERVFEGRRIPLGPTGRTRLTRIVLRALDEPSPETLARAVRVHAPYFALHKGEVPHIERGEDGTWHYTARLHPHGILRLYVQYTHVGAAKAFPERLRAGLVEAEGAAQVARPTSPAGYRVFAGVTEIGVRLEGIADAQGAVGVATRRYVFPPPALGHVQEHVLVPEEVEPIVGTITPGEGPRPPSLAGRVRVSQLEADGRAYPLAEVPVRADGGFVARLTGPGRYALEAILDFFPGTTRVTVVGGASFELTPTRPASWVQLSHPGLDLRQRPTSVRLEPLDGTGAEPIPPSGIRLGDGQSAVALPAGRWRIELGAEGTDALPPRRGSCEVASRGRGATACTLKAAELPHGELGVVVAPEAFGAARGATVRVGERAVTLIPGLSERAHFRHVQAGERDVRIEWDEAGRPPTVERPNVPAGGSTTVTIGSRGP